MSENTQIETLQSAAPIARTMEIGESYFMRLQKGESIVYFGLNTKNEYANIKARDLIEVRANNSINGLMCSVITTERFGNFDELISKYNSFSNEERNKLTELDYSRGVVVFSLKCNEK